MDAIQREQSPGCPNRGGELEMEGAFVRFHSFSSESRHSLELAIEVQEQLSQHNRSGLESSTTSRIVDGTILNARSPRQVGLMSQELGWAAGCDL